MIISHKHKFIFIKTRKTAGTSIEIALSKYCGNTDIITAIDDEDELIREELGFRSPQNYAIEWKNYKWYDFYHLLRSGDKAKFINHYSATKIKRQINPYIWNTYYKFCFERNPYEKVISRYNFIRGKGRTNMSFDEFLYSRELELCKNYKLYTIKNKIVVDQIFKYEDLKHSLATIAKKINLPEIPNLEVIRAKTKFRKNKSHFSKILTPPQIKRITLEFEKEFELLNFYQRVET